MARPLPSSTPLSFVVDAAGSVLRVALCGELDLACADLFDGLFDLDTTGIDTVVLDLGELTFCDVTGVNALTGLSAYHRCQGRAVRVVRVLPPVARLIAWTEAAALAARRDPAVG